jgi:hypothetical protein
MIHSLELELALLRFEVREEVVELAHAANSFDERARSVSISGWRMSRTYYEVSAPPNAFLLPSNARAISPLSRQSSQYDSADVSSTRSGGTSTPSAPMKPVTNRISPEITREDDYYVCPRRAPTPYVCCTPLCVQWRSGGRWTNTRTSDRNALDD